MADNPLAPLAFHPVINQGRIFVADQAHIFAFRSDTGRPAWGDSGPRSTATRSIFPAGSGQPFGTPRFTLTIADGRLYARMGSPITNPPQQPAVPVAAGSIVCLDLHAEGKLLWQVPAERAGPSTGPRSSRRRLFAAMRRSDIRPQAHVACFDTTTGRMRWRRLSVRPKRRPATRSWNARTLC